MKQTLVLLLLKFCVLSVNAQTANSNQKIFSFADSIFVCHDEHNSTKITHFSVSDKLPERIGWEISGNFGMYFANKYQAKFYDGRKTNENNIDYVFNNTYWRQEIVHLLDANVNRDSFQIFQLPADMKYDPAMYVGFSARYNFSSALALNVHFNFVKLQTRDMFTLKLYPPFSGQVESFEYCGLFGTEQRTNIDIGLMYALQPEKDLTAIAEFGVNISSTLVKKHIMRLYEREFNLVNIYLNNSYMPNVPLNEYDIRQGGIGFGVYASPGIRYVMNNHFTMELVANFYLKTINLEGYNKRLGIHTAPLFRFIFSPFFDFGQSKHDY